MKLENRRRELIEKEKDLVNCYKAKKPNLNISTSSKKLSFCETNVTVYPSISYRIINFITVFPAISNV